MQTDVVHDSRIGRLVELALMEDIGFGDVTTDATIPEEAIGRGEIIAKQNGVIAGLEIARLVFRYCDTSISLTETAGDGSEVQPGQVVATIDGELRGILRGERTALNFLQRMSGIATLTRRFVGAIAGTRAKITDTRKTAPGLRTLDKLAVRLGGGVNHRLGLDDMVLVKDNHVVAAGGIRNAVERCKTYLRDEALDIPIEVETKTLAEVDEALQCAGIKRIMLDNFTPPDMRRAVDRIGGRVEVEASGGITLDTVRSVAETGVDFISVGALTHSVQALDLSLEIIQPSG